MGAPAGVARDFEALERRRMDAVRLLEKPDLNRSEIARLAEGCGQTSGITQHPPYEIT